MKTRTYLGTLSLFLLSAAAHAAPVAIIAPPPNWVADPEQAAAIGHGDPKIAVEVFVPKVAGVALIASRQSAAPDPAQIRSELDDMFGAADRAKIIDTKVSVVERNDHYDADRKEIVATQSVKGDTLTISRLVVAMDATHSSAALGECIVRADAPALLVEACKTALVSLDPAIADRVAFALPASSAVTLEAPTASPPPRPQSSMSDGSRVPMPPIVVPQDASSTKDRRPIYVGAGLVVLALIFWWNRRMRDKFERNEKPKSDDDADDLHAAAKGETSDE